MTFDNSNTLDDDIILQFKKDENLAFAYLYKKYRMSFISNLSFKNSAITETDAVDIFQETLLVLYKKIINQEFDRIENIAALLNTIGQNIAFNDLRKNKRRQNLKSSDFQELSSSFINDDGNEEFNASQLLNHLGKRCRSIIEAYYLKGLRCAEIAELYNYSSANTVKSQKHKCISQLRKHFRNHGK